MLFVVTVLVLQITTDCSDTFMTSDSLAVKLCLVLMNPCLGAPK